MYPRHVEAPEAKSRSSTARAVPPESPFLSLNRLASAFEHRRVAETYSRGLVVLGTLKVVGWSLVGVWSQVPRYLLLLGLGVGMRFALDGARRWRRLAACGSLSALAIMVGLNAAGALHPQAPVVYLPNANAPFLRVLALAQKHAASPAFWTARAVPALVAILIAFELGALAVWLARLRAEELALLTGPRVPLSHALLRMFLDVHPGVFRYVGRDPFTSCLLVTSTIMLTWVAVDVSVLPQNQYDRLAEALGDCVGSRDELACVIAAGETSRAGVLLQLLFLLGVWPAIGSFLEKWSYTRAARIIAIDHRGRARSSPLAEAGDRKVILFLRAFQSDKVMLPRPRFSPLRFALSPSRTAIPLDALLVRELVSMGEPHALGSEQEATAPFGAVREYVDAEHWRERVAELASNAVAIVFVFDQKLEERTNLTWELGHLMKSPELRSKTLLLVHPSQPHDARDLRSVTSIAWRAAGRLGGFEPPDTPEPLLSVHLARDGSISGTTAPRVDRTTVLLALEHGFERIAASSALGS